MLDSYRAITERVTSKRETTSSCVKSLFVRTSRNLSPNELIILPQSPSVSKLYIVEQLSCCVRRCLSGIIWRVLRGRSMATESVLIFHFR